MDTPAYRRRRLPGAVYPSRIGDDGYMAKNRLLQSVRDMSLSLGLVLGVVGLVMLVTWRDTPDDPVRVVDTVPAQVGASTNAPYDVELPRDLGPDWRATSARVSPPSADPFRWHIGFVTPTDEYAAVGQSNGPAATYLDDERAAGDEQATVRIDGRTWKVLKREDGERTTLVRTSRGITTIVTGTGSVAELTSLAASLGPYVPPTASSDGPSPSLTPI